MKEGLLQQALLEGDFISYGKRILDELTAHISNTTSGKNSKTLIWNTPEESLEFWRNFLETGNSEDFIPEVLKRTTHIHHPKYMGHQVAATAPITALTAMVSSLLNNGMAVYEMGMAPSAIEKVVTDTICKKIGFHKDFGGLLTSGGTLANLTALIAARKAKASYDVWNEGYQKPLAIMVCEEAHYCVDRAAKIMGLGEKGIIKIPAKLNFSMDTAQLNQYYDNAIQNGLEVFAVIGSAPSTATGAYDNLEVISKFASEKKLWFHVDGAHGGAAIYSEKYKHLVKGIENADSVVIDGHKMMLMPTITTALLFKNNRHMQNTFSQKADYLLDDTPEEDWINSGKKTFECTKTMMCLHWFVLLKFYGEALFDEYLTRQYDLAKEFELLLKDQTNFELATSPQSNILCFRLLDDTKTTEELNTLNATVHQNLLEDGEFYIVQTKLKGIHYLRITLMNPFTTVKNLRALLLKIETVAKAFNS
jgi:L-2,4-diaminobutyrate decarboxylase